MSNNPEKEHIKDIKENLNVVVNEICFKVHIFKWFIQKSLINETLLAFNAKIIYILMFINKFKMQLLLNILFTVQFL